MKGDLVKKMREAAVITRAATNVMMVRTREANNQASTDELSAFRRELDVLRMENKVLRKEVERLRETTRKANPDENLYPILKESSKGASFKKRKRMRIPNTDSEEEMEYFPVHLQREVSPPPFFPSNVRVSGAGGGKEGGYKGGNAPLPQAGPGHIGTGVGRS